jgi:hypothetical protein
MMPPSSHPVQKMIEGDLAGFVELASGDAGALIRFRKPVPGGAAEVPGYPFRLAILWPYADAGSGALPTPQAREEMSTFEERLFEALGHDAHAVWVAVLTFDGARQWIFYTSNIVECGRRLDLMPQEAEPYPIEIDADEDSKWLYLREQILEHVDFED